MATIVLAVDGGATKTDVVLVDTDGLVLGRARGGPTNHQLVGIEAALDTLETLVGEALSGAGSSSHCSLGMFCLAGIDLPADEERIGPALAKRRFADRIELRNDTFALLRAGIQSTWGVATVCGTGLNCVAIGPNGRSVRFPSLGELSGDFTPGGLWLGVRALGLALRAGDGRGTDTSLRQLVADHFGVESPEAVLESVYTGTISYGRLPELAEVALDAAADGDAPAAQATALLAAEVVAMTTAAIRRLDVATLPVEVVLGGGIFDTRHRTFVASVEAGILECAAKAVLGRLDAAPVLGAALLALDQYDTSPAIQDDLRRQLR